MVLVNEMVHVVLYIWVAGQGTSGSGNPTWAGCIYSEAEKRFQLHKKSYLDELTGPLLDASCQRGGTCPGESQVIESRVSCQFFNVISISFFLSRFPVLDAQKIHLD